MAAFGSKERREFAGGGFGAYRLHAEEHDVGLAQSFLQAGGGYDRDAFIDAQTVDAEALAGNGIHMHGTAD